MRENLSLDKICMHENIRRRFSDAQNPNIEQLLGHREAFQINTFYTIGGSYGNEMISTFGVCLSPNDPRRDHRTAIARYLRI
jgi:hypothetical protein